MRCSQLDRALWQAVQHSPKAFLKRIDQRRLEAVADDPVSSQHLNASCPPTTPITRRRASHDVASLPGDTLIAYFCAEFGFHESLPIYSGGLGILAGDHCKAASDMRLPFVGVGLLYRQGYFHQTIDATATQHATYGDSDFDDLPMSPVLRRRRRRAAGRRRISRARRRRPRSGRRASVTSASILLDTDVDENSPARPRHHPPASTAATAPRASSRKSCSASAACARWPRSGSKPTVWHINEGHAAFLILERMRALVAEGADLACALEAVAGNTVFTTHTPVPAGHDHFAAEMVAHYFERWCTRVGRRRRSS